MNSPLKYSIALFKDGIAQYLTLDKIKFDHIKPGLKVISFNRRLGVVTEVNKIDNTITIAYSSYCNSPDYVTKVRHFDSDKISVLRLGLVVTDEAGNTGIVINYNCHDVFYVKWSTGVVVQYVCDLDNY